ncbi:protein GLUTAMINE DUMPER 5-like [Tripterygium wilfordii]|uniref:Protein GLUTAMINE DUMPER 5-like n=1 Tax=Tripterygium wilfordii TaxID=458696 RepID=A0A7J7DAJ9_TRIWF|nr:protein GLUTAMINE DUMPER 3-like [Tripterygium wilfordii]KAF5743380.1 protein GLUTAMINE DUMPER 5-like [Tripterygium wilfordii]
MRSLSTYSTTTSIKASPPSSLSLSPSPPSTPTLQQQRSPWHSPVPYLFGGLAAMLGLIAFALLILACSYWRLSGRLEDENEDQQRDLDNGKESGDSAEKTVKVYEENILVIMAGDGKPTFLATPSSRRTTSSADKNEEESEQSTEEKTECSSEKIVKEEESSTNHHQTETH